MLRNAIGRVTVLSALIGLAGASAQAQDTYPTRPVTIVVPFAAGGPTDALARLITSAMSQTLGQQIIVENVAGAGGTIGSARVARAEPDGYTLLMGHAGYIAANKGLYKTLPYDSVKDFDPVGFMGDVPQILIAKKSLPAQTAAEFLDYVKAGGDKLNAGHAGIGSASHLGGLMLNAALGTNVELVGYRGAGPAMNDLIAGQIDLMVDVSTTAVPQIKAGTVKPFGVLRAKRLSVLPDVPTMAELGYPKVEANIWNVLLCPKGTPQPVMDRLNASLRQALADPAVRERLASLGVEPPGDEFMTTEGARAHIEAEIDRWLPIVKASGASAE